ncbi:hypothetical protein [Sporosarcina sp. USHLN248]
MPNWIQSGSIYYVQPTRKYTHAELQADLDKLYAKLASAKLKQKGMTA